MTKIEVSRGQWFNLRFRRLMTAWSSSYSKDPFANKDSVLPTFNVEQWAEFLSDSHIQVFSTHVKSHAGYLLFPGKSGPPDPQLRGRDFFGEILDACHKRNIKTVGMMQLCSDIYAGVKYPSWSQINENGERSYKGKDPWYLCFNNPERQEYLLSQIEEIVRRYPTMDGILFDEYAFKSWEEHWYCYCDCCRKQFKNKFGKEPPREVNFTDSLWLDFINWRQDCLEKFFRTVRELVKSINPHLPVSLIFYASNWTNNWKSGQNGVRLSQYLDYITHDLAPFSLLRESEMFKYYRALKPGVVNEYVLDFYIAMGTSRRGLTDFNHGVPSPLAIAAAGTGISTGSAVGIDFIAGPGGNGIPTGETANCIKRVMGHVRQFEEYLPDCEPISFAGLISSEKTATLYGGSSSSLWRSSYLGAYKAMLESHFIFSVLPSEMLDGNPIREEVLFLPNIVVMSDREVEIIRRFIAEGGGLVATYATSLYDEQGRKRDNFALADVLGVDYLGGKEEDTDFLSIEGPYNINYCVSTTDHEIVRNLGHFEFNLLTCSVLKVKLQSGSRGLAFLPDRKEAHQKEYPLQNQLPTREIATKYPIVVISQYGKGKVVYIAAKIDAQYASNAHPWTRRLIKQSLLWAAKSPMPIELTGPMSVEINAYHQKKSKRLIIHLVNFQSASSRTLSPFTGDGGNVPNYLVEEILPVFNLKLRISPELFTGVKKIYLVPGQKTLEHETDEAGWVNITIPQIDIHAMVVLEKS